MKRNVLILGGHNYVGNKLIKALSREDIDLMCLKSTTKVDVYKESYNAVLLQDYLEQTQKLTKLISKTEFLYLILDQQEDNVLVLNEVLIFVSNLKRIMPLNMLKRIVFLTSLIPSCTNKLSPKEVIIKEISRKLWELDVPLFEFRSAVILGIDSVYVDVIKNIACRLQLIFVPVWLHHSFHLIDIDDVLDYLLEALYVNVLDSFIVDLGSDSSYTIFELVELYARLTGREKRMLTLPFSSPLISAAWLIFFTSSSFKQIKSSIEYINRPTELNFNWNGFKHIKPKSIEFVFKKYIAYEKNRFSKTWRNFSKDVSLSSNLLTASKSYHAFQLKIQIFASLSAVFISLQSHKTMFAHPVLKIFVLYRSFLDKFFGGVGFRKRRDLDILKVGDVLFYWRVKECIKNRKLVLVSELTGLQSLELIFQLQQNQSGVELSLKCQNEKSNWAQRVFWCLFFSLNLAMVFLILNNVKQVSEKGISIASSSVVFKQVKKQIKKLKFH